jgi:hypothetical protein
MPFEPGHPKYGGRKKGSPSKAPIMSRRPAHYPVLEMVSGPKSVSEILKEEGVEPAREMILCYKKAMAVFDNYGTIFEAISKAREMSGLFPTEDKGHIYLKIAADIIKDLAHYSYPKLKTIEHIKPAKPDLLPDQKVTLMKRYIDVLENIKNGRPGTDGIPSAGGSGIANGASEHTGPKLP